MWKVLMDPQVLLGLSWTLDWQEQLLEQGCLVL